MKHEITTEIQSRQEVSLGPDGYFPVNRVSIRIGETTYGCDVYMGATESQVADFLEELAEIIRP